MECFRLSILLTSFSAHLVFGLKQTDAPMGGSADNSNGGEEYAVEKYDGVVECLI